MINAKETICLVALSKTRSKSPSQWDKKYLLYISFVIKFRYDALPHSPCDTSRQRLSLFLLLFILLLRYALSSTRISSTKLDVVLSSSSSSVSEELHTSITAKLSSNSPPSISKFCRASAPALLCYTTCLCSILLLAGVQVCRKTVSTSQHKSVCTPVFMLAGKRSQLVLI